MKQLAVLTALSLSFATPALAQAHDHMTMPMPPPASAAPSDMKPGMPMASEKTDGAEIVAPPEAGADLPPDAPTDFAADEYFSKDRMAAARTVLADEHGGVKVSKFMLNELEYGRARGEDGYRWDGEAWFGGDIHRVVIKSEGAGGQRLDDAEVQALYSRALGPYTDLQMGLRYDIEPNPSRAYATLGFETLLPYWFEAEGAVFVGGNGRALARLGGRYDLLLTQRLAVQPHAELNFAAKRDAATGTGSGLSDAQLGLRLRYEVRREFAPYVGVVWQKRLGETADFARAAGDRVDDTSFVVGLRAWY